MRKLLLKSVLNLAALSVAVGSSVVGHAQASQDTPESVAKAYFAAMQSGDWAKCASLMHNDALASMKRMLATAINADKSGDAAKTIFKLKNSAEYTQLSDAAVFERLMDFITRIAPEMKTALAASTNTILGRVDENPDLAHIVYRTQTKLANAETSEVEMITFKKQGATWRALLTSDMEETLNRFAEELAPAPPDSKDDDKNAPGGAKKPGRKP